VLLEVAMGGSGRHGRFAWTVALAVALLEPPCVAAHPGDLDVGFGVGGKVATELSPYWARYNFITSLMRDDDGRIVAGGVSSAGGVLARYLANGTLDPTFGEGGITLDDRLYSILPPPYARAFDGSFYAAGFAFDYESGLLLRYDANGKPDPTFGTDGALAIDFDPSHLLPRPDGTLLVAGACRWPSSGPGLIRLLADGSVDPSFAGFCYWSSGGDFRTLRLTTPDRIVAAGIDWHNDGSGRVLIGHALADGRPDPGVGAPFVTAEAVPFRPILVQIQADGRVVAIDEGNQGTMHLARFNGDGSLDPTFGSGGLVTITRPWDLGSYFGALAIQLDGRILIAGAAHQPSADDGDFFVARLRPDGTLDDGFGNDGFVFTDIGTDPSEFQDIVYALLEQPDGKIVAAGGSSDSAGRGPLALARYGATSCGNGVLDAGEVCDDGAANGTSASCCTAACQPRNDGAACDTGSACVENETCHGGICQGAPIACATCTSCDSGTGCVFAPRPDCADVVGSVHAALDLRRPVRPRGRRLTFRWAADAPFATAELGDPVGGDDYALCVYEPGESAASLRFAAGVPAGGVCGKRPCWRRKGDRIVYRNPANDPEGLTKVTIDGHRGHLELVGRGASLALPALPLSTPLVAELRVAGGGCWRMPADATTVRWNEPMRFRAEAR
jgi:uncharacterized delta-60 repeat protein